MIAVPYSDMTQPAREPEVIAAVRAWEALGVPPPSACWVFVQRSGALAIDAVSSLGARGTIAYQPRVVGWSRAGAPAAVGSSTMLVYQEPV